MRRVRGAGWVVRRTVDTAWVRPRAFMWLSCSCTSCTLAVGWRPMKDAKRRACRRTTAATVSPSAPAYNCRGLVLLAVSSPQRSAAVGDCTAIQRIVMLGLALGDTEDTVEMEVIRAYRREWLLNDGQIQNTSDKVRQRHDLQSNRGVLDVSIIQGPVSVAPCQTLISRFATFSSLYATQTPLERVRG
jgi:hypothetical protein